MMFLVKFSHPDLQEINTIGQKNNSKDKGRKEKKKENEQKLVKASA